LTTTDDARPSEHRRIDPAPLLSERILVLDGAMGTMIQGRGLGEADFRGDLFGAHPIDLQGNNDLLCLTRPDVIEDVHREFLAAGADIIETNTFNANAVSQADYQLQEVVYDLNVAAAVLARRAAQSYSTAERPRLVAGAIGPTSTTLSISPDVDDPSFRSVRFHELVEAYALQVRGLLDGGVDLLLAETSFDTLNIKAAIYAIESVLEERNERVPLMLSATITDRSGRTLSGQTIDAFWTSVSHARPMTVGINCALGAADMRAYVEELSGLATSAVCIYPNAGLPNEFGGYDQSPEHMAALLGEFAQSGWLNIVGGCCGTTPDHIAAIADAVTGLPPRTPAEPSRWSRFSGLETLEIRDDSNFIMVGERTNVTGSRRFARLIRTGDYEGAVSVAGQQVEGGANILDVNMDEGLLDSVAAMTKFLDLLATEPAIARLPFMIDSSRFEVIEAGLACVQGKAIVNSISLKEGEDTFLDQARTVRRYGAAVVVMAFDEAGQAVTKDRKVEILTRAYHLLTTEVGFDPLDIIFDANILTVATGIEEHDGYALAYIQAVQALHDRFPAVHFIGGVSNLSFGFRGHDTMREAMHACFLYEAIKAGLDMGIVNAGQLTVYTDVEPPLRERIEDVLFVRRPDATERLVAFAANIKDDDASRQIAQKAWRDLPLDERLSHALVHGVVEYMEADLTEALDQYPKALSIIEGPLMAGMTVVGDLFGSGKMFLPQVVKTARAMKRAVLFLEPHMPAGTGVNTHGTVLLATVKGDVHDIGKNIVGVVLACNGFEVIDLGVMVPSDDILARAEEIGADIIGLSGLITPSLDHMVHVAKEMKRRGFRQPLLIGGATTSRRHTAVKIAPQSDDIVLHVLDASRAARVVRDLMNDDARKALDDARRIDQETDRTIFKKRRQTALVSLEEARASRPAWSTESPARPSFTGARTVDVSVDDLIPFIDWTPFFVTWELRGRYPAILDHPERGPAARELFDHAQITLARLAKILRPRGVYGFFPAASQDDDIIVYDDAGGAETHLCMLRQQRQKRGTASHYHCLADFIAPSGEGDDWIGAFAVTSGAETSALVSEAKACDDDYEAIMIAALADRLAEAFAEHLHARARGDWGYEAPQSLDSEDLLRERYRGIRPAPGYPACPDHSEKEKLWSLLQVEQKTGITLTESYAMWPAASVSGWYFSHPDSRYFTIHVVSREQVEDYARRQGVPRAETERWLGPYLGYEP
jgi:5-methyltetrahydrofolate--homocysteine methyltransferase